MGELTFDGIQFMIDGKPLGKCVLPRDLIVKSSVTNAESIAKLKSEMDAMAEKYKPIADKLVEEIYKSSQKPIELFSEETAQQISKAFGNIQKTMEKDFPMAFAKRKAHKHYKPKFTL